ncbi:MAG: DUF3310 domain-containing protein [Anaerocolumna aminovalerica]|uniref:DUF3310 domain-containing protein n=1 Tax=Anaerocolumna aminovalerica TaxID=1527 RepID=UPI002906EFE0|nr:DUF3310 domain-containing protein [Anaerocolumna aminovalerica]MDU6263728.1 DUF3310 domain-containing protein [Anaerocolumna aminovalerica]
MDNNAETDYKNIPKSIILTSKMTTEINDKINHPSHYTDGKIEVIDYIEDKKFNYHLGNAIKYISRAGKKDDYVQDLEKAKWYINREIERYQKEHVPGE